MGALLLYSIFQFVTVGIFIFVLWPLDHPAHMISWGLASALCINGHTGSCKRIWIVCVNSCLWKMLCVSPGVLIFKLNGKRERKCAKNRDTGETCAKDPAVSLRIQNVHYPTTSVKDMHTSRDRTGQLLALHELWRMRQTQHYGILRTREGKSLRTRSDVPLKYAPVSQRLIMALWNVKEHVS